MGRLYLIEFDQTPEARFYLCRTCQTHIALEQYFEKDHALDGTIGGIISKVVNVYTDRSDDPNKYRKSGALTVDDGYCNKCSNLLGFKIIDTGNEPELDGYEGTFFCTSSSSHTGMELRCWMRIPKNQFEMRKLATAQIHSCKKIYSRET